MKGYTSRDRIEKYLLIAIDASFHDQVDEWIGAIEAYIDRETGRNFIADEEGVSDGDGATARFFDGSGCDKQLIDDCVEIEKVEVGVDDLSEIEEGDYLTYPANHAAKGKPITRLELRAGFFPKGKQNVKVTARWGYSEEVPDEIRLAATVLVAGIINFSNTAEGEVQSETIGRYSVTYKTERQWTDFERVASTLKGFKKFHF